MTVQVQHAPVQEEQQVFDPAGSLLLGTVFQVYGSVKNSASLPSVLKSGLSAVETAVGARVVPAYGQVKEYSPMLKTGLESVESASGTVLCRLDTRLVQATDLGKSVSQSVTNTVNQTMEKVNTRVIHPVLEAKGTISTAVQEAKEREWGEWKDLRGELTKKAIARLEKGLDEVKEFSATRGKEMIHLDLIAYSFQVLDNAQQHTQQLLLPLQQQIMTAVAQTRIAVISLQEAVLARSAQGAEQVDAVREQLKLKLDAALISARTAALDLSARALAFAQAKFSSASASAASHLPEQERFEAVLKTLAARSPRLHASVLLLLQSPQLFNDVKSKADVDTSKRAVENIRNLIAAVKEVLVTNYDAATCKISEAAEEEEEEEEEKKA